jgi:hypothetical protein
MEGGEKVGTNCNAYSLPTRKTINCLPLVTTKIATFTAVSYLDSAVVGKVTQAARPTWEGGRMKLMEEMKREMVKIRRGW